MLVEWQFVCFGNGWGVFGAWKEKKGVQHFQSSKVFPPRTAKIWIKRRNGVGDDSEIKQKAKRTHYESGGETFDILIASKSHNLMVSTSRFLCRLHQESFSAMFVIHYSPNQIKSNIIKVVSGEAERLKIEKTRNLLEQFEYKISLLVWKQFIEPEGFDIFIYRLDSNEKHLVKAAVVDGVGGENKKGG